MDSQPPSRRSALLEPTSPLPCCSPRQGREGREEKEGERRKGGGGGREEEGERRKGGGGKEEGRRRREVSNTVDVFLVEMMEKHCSPQTPNSLRSSPPPFPSPTLCVMVLPWRG